MENLREAIFVSLILGRSVNVCFAPAFDAFVRLQLNDEIGNMD